MKPRAFAALFVLLPVFAFFDMQSSPIRGTWTVQETCKNFVDIQADFRTSHGQHGNTMKIARADIKPAGQAAGSVQFAVVRAAGTFNFTGTLVDDMGSGQVTFAANPQFSKDMATLGYSNLSDSDVFRMAMIDVTPQFAR